jgi:hypothetical protein
LLADDAGANHGSGIIEQRQRLSARRVLHGTTPIVGAGGADDHGRLRDVGAAGEVVKVCSVEALIQHLHRIYAIGKPDGGRGRRGQRLTGEERIDRCGVIGLELGAIDDLRNH